MNVPLLLFFFYYYFCSTFVRLSWRRNRRALRKGRNLCLYTDLLAVGEENTEGKILFRAEAAWHGWQSNDERKDTERGGRET